MTKFALKSKVHYCEDIPALVRFIQKTEPAGRILVSSEKLYRILNLSRLTSGPARISRSILVASDGEKCKSFSAASKVIRALLNLNGAKSDIITVAGGGSLTDAGAFCASIYKRGAGLSLVPTTLLAMIDAAHGGKTAVNEGGVKNCAGSFYAAGEIVICPEFLTTLPESEIENGLFEALKYAALFSAPLLKMIVENRAALKKYNSRSGGLFLKIIKKCVGYKNKIVSADPFDSGERMALNFGHTFAHAFESVSGGRIAHGAAVGLGMFAELSLAGFICGETEGNKSLASALMKFIRDCAVYKKLDRLIKRDAIFEKLHELMAHDKKARGNGTIRMPVVKRAGTYSLEDISLSRHIIPFLKSKEYMMKEWNG
jgi:3-dehydroquinate synthase